MKSLSGLLGSEVLAHQLLEKFKSNYSKQMAGYDFYNGDTVLVDVEVVLPNGEAAVLILDSYCDEYEAGFYIDGEEYAFAEQRELTEWCKDEYYAAERCFYDTQVEPDDEPATVSQGQLNKIWGI